MNDRERYREVDFLKDGKVYTLTVDINDPKDLVLEQVTLRDQGPGGGTREIEIDIDDFVNLMDDDDWEQVEVSLGIA